MPKYQQGDEQMSDGVNLLISILVRYPEVGSISFDPTNQSLKLAFLLSGSPEKKQTAFLVKHIMDSISAYHVLKGEKETLVDVRVSNYEPMAMLTIIRDVYSLSRGEIALLIALLRDKAKELLVTDPNEALLEEDLLVQEELIENMLENMKKEYDSHSLIGIREDGRVLVFNK